MMTPKISIIMPVYNAQEHLHETIESVRSQTFEDFEVICVDDGSADSSVEIIKRVMEQDSRFVLLHQKNAGAGAARNRGFEAARGEYAIFLDSDDLFSPLLLEKLYQSITSNQADIAACNFSRFTPDGKENQQEGVHTKWIPNGLEVFSYRDCPDQILRVVNPTPWNKLYRSAFIREKGLKFEEISSTNDITFAAVSVAAAERVSHIPDSLVRYRIGHSGTISSGKTKKGKLNNVKIAVLRAAEQALALPHGADIKNSVLSFVIDNFLFSLTRYINDFTSHEAADFYRMVHGTFNRPEFADVTHQILNNYKQYAEFCTVKKHTYETMKDLVRKRLIVSLTTYPRRIGTLGRVLQSIYAQTRQPDEIVLYLAEEQFPGKEADIPEDLLQLVAENRLKVRWCDDLKPHKKYFYALQEYPDDLVVTIDDDLLYNKYMLNSLFASYLLYPNAVSTVRAHLIILNEQNQILPYSCWIQETDNCLFKPSMQLMATGGAGVLHPPGLFRKEFFDKNAIMEICPWADDLWLKAMQLISDVPVVVARQHEQLRYLPDSQGEALHLINVRQGQNDVQLANISKWLDEKFEPGVLVKKLTEESVGERLLGMETVSHHLDMERRNARVKTVQAESKLKQAESKCRQTESKLQGTEKKLQNTETKLRDKENKLRQTESKLRQTENRLRQTENRLRQTEQKLQRVQRQKAQLETLASVGGQYQELGRFLKELKASRGMSLSWCFKYFLYLLAWIPAKLLIAIIYYLKNGFTATFRRLLQKLLRRG